MSSILSIATAGLTNATAQFNQATSNVVNNSVTGGDQTGNIVALQAAKTQVNVNAAVVKVAENLNQDLVNILA